MEKQIYSLIIIGGGPAGMSAGIYASRQRIKTLLLTKDFGGQMAKKAVPIENYPGFEKISAFDLISRMKNHLKKSEIEIKEGEEVISIEKENEIFEVKTKKGNTYFSHSIIVATGADPRKLKIPGEEEFLGKGVSYCVLCDGPLFKEKEVAVIGGGESGFEAAVALANWAKKIYILEFAKEVKASQKIQEEAKRTQKIEVITQAKVKEIRGEKFVKEILFEDQKEKKDKILKVNGVFVEIGTVPASNFLKGLVEFNEKGEIKVNPRTQETSLPGIFAAGDVTDNLFKQIVVAAGEGAKAALSAYFYLKKKNLL